MLKPSRAKRLSDLLPEAIGPVTAKQGFAGGEIVSRWAEIVGPDLAAVSAPVKLAVPPRAPAADPAAPPPRATLSLRVEGAFALEAQHRAHEIIERVNAHLGWPCVGDIRIRQGSIAPQTQSRPGRAGPPPATAEQRAAVAKAIGAIEDEGLAGAVARLGEAALAAGKSRTRR